MNEFHSDSNYFLDSIYIVYNPFLDERVCVARPPPHSMAAEEAEFDHHSDHSGSHSVEAKSLKHS